MCSYCKKKNVEVKKWLNFHIIIDFHNIIYTVIHLVFDISIFLEKCLRINAVWQSQ